jgi:chromosome segregation ATPase
VKNTHTHTHSLQTYIFISLQAKNFQNEAKRLEISLAAAVKSEFQAKKEINALKAQLEQLQEATTSSSTSGTSSSSSANQLVASQREINLLKANYQKMKQEKATIVAEYGEFVNVKAELEEKVTVAERSLQQMENHNIELQQQLREVKKE